MADVKSYNAADVDIVFGTVLIDGKADGTFLSIERRADGFTQVVGADGEGMRSKSNDKSATMTLTLMQSSSKNDELSILAQADELSGTGVFPFAVRDRSGTTICTASTAWITKFSNVEYAKEASEREWVLETNDLRMNVGGN